MNENNSMDENCRQNIYEYKKIFDVSVLNSENETPYYASMASIDQLNNINTNNKSPVKKGKYYSPKKSNTEEWNKNISRAINKINQIMDNDESSITHDTFFIDSDSLKHQDDFKDPFIENKDLFPSNGIEINTTENKRKGITDKPGKSSHESSKKKNKKNKESKKKNKKNSKESKKRERDELSSKSTNDKKESSESKGKHKKNHHKNNNETTENRNIVIDTTLKPKDDSMFLKSINSSEASINQIIQKNLSEYSKDITELINKDNKDNRSKKESETEKTNDNENVSSKPLILNNLNSTIKELINQNINNNTNNMINNNGNQELNNKILYIDKLIKEFKEKEDQKSINTPMANKSREIPLMNTIKNNGNNEEISIEIRCPFYSNGCQWCNKQSKLSDHLLYECTFCPNIITNAFATNPAIDKKSVMDNSNSTNNKTSYLDDLNQKLAKLTLNINNNYNNNNNNSNDKTGKKSNHSNEFDVDVLSFIFSNYLNDDESKLDKEKSIKDKQDRLFDQIIQDYHYTNEDHNHGSKLTLDTRSFNYNSDDLISTADINFNNEPLTWDINSEKDNKVPWSESPTSAKFKERKKYRLSDTNNEVKIKNKRSPASEVYAGKRLLKKYDNLISYYDYPNKNDMFNKTPKTEKEVNDKKRYTPPAISPEKPFDPSKTFKFNLPKQTKPVQNQSTKSSPTSKPSHNIAKDINDITACINTQLMKNNNKDISSMFTPQEIEVLMDIWFKKENNEDAETNLIFNNNETSFIQNLLTSFDEKTKNNLKEFNYLKSKDPSYNLLKSIDNLLEARKNEAMKNEDNQSRYSSFNNLNIDFGRDFSFDFNYERWNQSREQIPVITKDLNKAFVVSKEKKRNDNMEYRKNKFKYMILCWILKLFSNNTIYTICWKLINIIYDWIKYLKNKFVQKAIESSKHIDNHYKKLYEKEKNKEPKKEIVSRYINNNVESKNDSTNNLLFNWSPNKKYQREGRLLMKKKKFNKAQASYYRINKHRYKHKKSQQHTFYTDFLEYQTNRGFKSLNIQNNIRKKIKMMQTINDIKSLKTTSMISSKNKNKKRKVEVEKKHHSVASYFNNTLNFVMNSLLNNAKINNTIVNGPLTKKKMHIFGAEANIDFNKHTLIIYNKKTSELNYIPKQKNKHTAVKKAIKLNEIDQLIIYNNDESGWMNILTSKPISNNMDLFYYEVKVSISNISKKCLYSWSIGFSTSKVQLNKYPDRLYSWDYYNTGSINKNNSLEKYGETFTQNDVIGCGIDFKNNLAFFTKNGNFLGVAVSNFITDDLELYPNIGLFNYAKVETNFGSKDFIFNIKSYFCNKFH